MDKEKQVNDQESRVTWRKEEEWKGRAGRAGCSSLPASHTWDNQVD